MLAIFSTNHNVVRPPGILQRRPRFLLLSILVYGHHIDRYKQQFSVPQTRSFHGHRMSPFLKTVRDIAVSLRCATSECGRIYSSNLQTEFRISTFRSRPSFPANANKRVVFPEFGGPKSNVILHIYEHLDIEVQRKSESLDQNPKFQLANLFTEIKSLIHEWRGFLTC